MVSDILSNQLQLQISGAPPRPALVQPSSLEECQSPSLWDRLGHVTWANFNLTLSTGGIGLLLSKQPHRFPGLTTIGKIVYIFDLFLILFLTAIIMRRFMLNRQRLSISLLRPGESLFFPTFLLSLVTAIVNMESYAGPSNGQ
jgi:tellurite resistance protein TehA-like permease